MIREATIQDLASLNHLLFQVNNRLLKIVVGLFTYIF